MSASNEQAGAAQAGAAQASAELDDELVRDYLMQHPDFLQRNPDLLDQLHVSHASGSAVSLVEKQVAVLRERNVDMRRRLSTLSGNARENDRLHELTSALLLKFLEADSVASLYRTFIDGMSGEFGIEHSSMILFDDAGGSAGGECRVESQDSANSEIGPLLKGQRAVCGALRKQELNYLFPEAGEVGSAALVPLSNGEPLGLIAVGSSDGNRYNSDMGTLFLSHIADVIVRLLPRLTHSAA